MLPYRDAHSWPCRASLACVWPLLVCVHGRYGTGDYRRFQHRVGALSVRRSRLQAS